MNGKSKGNAFERQFCKDLSLWWSDYHQDDVFWRSQTSGARSTIRCRQGLETRGQAGDVAATDSRGELLTKIICFELKRGYSTFGLEDLLNRDISRPPAKYLEWFLQAETSRQQMGSYTWAVVIRKDRRESIIFFPSTFATFLEENVLKVEPVPSVCLSIPYRESIWRVWGVQLQHFFDEVDPDLLREKAIGKGIAALPDTPGFS